MAEIYQIPESGSTMGGLPFSIPIGGGNGGLFGNGNNSLADLFGFASYREGYRKGYQHGWEDREDDYGQGNNLGEGEAKQSNRYL